MAKLNKNLVIKNKSTQPLQLFEAADSTPSSKKYIFQGVFTACSTDDHIVVNRNNRVYGEKECLRHLAYLRENIQQNGFILGELDHPVDRFDTQLKEASHMITDLWYDQNTHCVMGKLEVMDTPNGEICRKLIDAGYPLFVSSRAAGEVDPKTKEVHIEQIFTYDIVCTPGFAEARLSRVDENLAENAANYLNESAQTIKKEKKTTKKYGVLVEGVTVSETSIEVPVLSESAKKAMDEADIEKLSKPLLESDEKKEDDDNGFKLPEMDTNPITANEGDGDNDDKKEDNANDSSDSKADTSNDEKKDGDDTGKEEKKELTDEEKKERRARILNVEAFDADGDNATDAEKEEKRAEILDVEAKEEKSEDEDKDAESSDDENIFDENSEEEKTDECNTPKEEECDGADCKKPSDDECDSPLTTKEKDAKVGTKDAEKVLNDADKADDIKKQTEKDMDKYKKLLDKAKKVSDVKESIINTYPFSISLSDENFARFAALQPADKRKCELYIESLQTRDIKLINEQWATPLIKAKRELKNWLRYAPEEYRTLYAKAPMDIQEAIEESAKLVTINNAADALRFWEKTGLAATNDKILAESLNESYSIVEKEGSELSATAAIASGLGYDRDYFKMVEDYFANE